MKKSKVFFAIFFKILPQLSDFVNSDREKIVFEVNKKQIFSCEKMRNLGNCIYNYTHSFFGEDFQSIIEIYWEKIF